jgi:hypothetical protein
MARPKLAQGGKAAPFRNAAFGAAAIAKSFTSMFFAQATVVNVEFAAVL